MHPARVFAVAFGAALVGFGYGAEAAPGDMSLGPAEAKVTVIEYASPTCSHCARWDQDVFPEFKAKYLPTGKVRFVLRELPTEPASLAVAAFLLARCEPAKYFDALDDLWRDQDQLFKDQDGKGWLLRAGAKVGLNEDKVRSCVEDRTALDALVARGEANLKEFKVTGTPTVLVNGAIVGTGEIAWPVLEKAIDGALAKSGAEPGHPALSGRRRHRRH